MLTKRIFSARPYLICSLNCMANKPVLCDNEVHDVIIPISNRKESSILKSFAATKIILV